MVQALNPHGTYVERSSRQHCHACIIEKLFPQDEVYETDQRSSRNLDEQEGKMHGLEIHWNGSQGSL
jgi:hypothetical protein